MEGCTRTYRIEREEGGAEPRAHTRISMEEKNIKSIPSVILPPPTSSITPPPLTLQDYHAPLALQTFLAQQPLLQQSRGSPNGP